MSAGPRADERAIQSWRDLRSTPDGLAVIIQSVGVVLTLVGLWLVFRQLRAARYQNVVAALGQLVQLMRDVNQVFIDAAFLGELDGGRPLPTRELLYRFGLRLKTRGIDSIVSAAAESQVPIYCPAIVDSAYGDAILLLEGAGRRPVFDEAADYVEFMGLAPQLKETAVIYIGGGVPKDFIQTLAVTSGLLPAGRRRGTRAATYRGRSERPYYPHKYALQITADSPHWGGSSGASLTEGISWGKQMVAGTRVDCRCDVTIALPLLVQALSEQRVSRRRRPFSALFTGGA